MDRLIKKAKQVLKVTLLTAVLAAWLVGPGFAGELEEILPIKPVPDFNTSETLKKIASKTIVHGSGHIQRIGENEIVIGDRLFDILPETAYYRSDGTPTFFSEFTIGKLVVYRLKTKYQVLELWSMVD